MLREVNGQTLPAMGKIDDTITIETIGGYIDEICRLTEELA